MNQCPVARSHSLGITALLIGLPKAGFSSIMLVIGS